MKKRSGLSKKNRFEVFKRDLFCCQYCGQKPPAVVLEVDHIKAVSAGGRNDVDNLITSCFDCNRGKGKRDLRVSPMSVLEKARVASEREEQLKELDKVAKQKRRRLTKAVNRVCAIYETHNPGFALTDSARRSILTFLNKMPSDEVEDAMERACCRGIYQKFKYFCGICWGIIRDREGN